MVYNSTIRVKKKRCVSCGTLQYIFSKGRCEPCARVENHQALLEKDQEPDAESVAILKKDADILFSRLIRLRATAPITGLCRCYICNAEHHWKDMQAMHYTHREDSSLRLHPKNVRCGCENCNIHLDGNLKAYAEKLEAEELGLSEWLYLEGKQLYKFTREELKQMIADFSREIIHLQKIKHLK